MEFQKQYQNATASFSTVGGEMTGLSIGDREIIWTGDTNYWGGHAPVLFPICSALKNGRIRIGGAQYSLPKHGFAKRQQFQMKSQTDNSVTFVLQANEETMAQYPFDFSLEITHQFDDAGFTTAYTVSNLGQTPMPYCIGGHPGLCTGDLERWELIFDKQECGPFYNVSEQGWMDQALTSPVPIRQRMSLSYSHFDRDALILIEPKSDKVSLIHKDTKHGYELTFSDFSVLALWTVSNKRAPFLCLEPWNGLPPYCDESGNMEDKPYVTVLQPKQSRTVSYQVKCI